jgi:hypothetical protein
MIPFGVENLFNNWSFLLQEDLDEISLTFIELLIAL